MNQGEVIARHYRSGKPTRVAWKDGVITALEPAKAAPDNLVIAPPLFDLQVNGYAGIDFQADNLSVDELKVAVRKMRESACPHIFFTVITDEWQRLIERLRHVQQLRLQDAELASAIAGFHVEGPFMSELPGFHGAHDPKLMRDGKPEHLADLRAVLGDTPTLLTVAPERAGAIEFIRAAVQQGFRISLGHTNAPLETINAAIAAGATAFTHLGNGCPGDLHRADNILWRVFNTRGLTAGIICDTIHVTPQLFRVMHKQLDQIYYTTDCMSAAGGPPGLYPLGKLKLEVGPDEVVRVPGKANFAGSALRPYAGVQRAVRMLREANGPGADWRDIWDRFSIIPRNLMKLSRVMEVSTEASYCVLETAAGELADRGTVYFKGTATPLNP